MRIDGPHIIMTVAELEDITESRVRHITCTPEDTATVTFFETRINCDALADDEFGDSIWDLAVDAFGEYKTYQGISYESYESMLYEACDMWMQGDGNNTTDDIIEAFGKFSDTDLVLEMFECDANAIATQYDHECAMAQVRACYMADEDDL